VLFGLAISFSVIGYLSSCRILTGRRFSRKYIDALNASLTPSQTVAFQMRPEVFSEADRARAAVIISRAFREGCCAGPERGGAMVIDAQDANTANIMRATPLPSRSHFFSSFGQRRNGDQSRYKVLVQPRPRVAEIYRARSLCRGACIVSAPACRFSDAREGEQNTILQVYVSSISAHEFLLGKILAFFLIGLAEWLLALIAAALVRDDCTDHCAEATLQKRYRTVRQAAASNLLQTQTEQCEGRYKREEPLGQADQKESENLTK